jgi:hypothetical protein
MSAWIPITLTATMSPMVSSRMTTSLRIRNLPKPQRIVAMMRLCMYRMQAPFVNQCGNRVLTLMPALSAVVVFFDLLAMIGFPLERNEGARVSCSAPNIKKPRAAKGNQRGHSGFASMWFDAGSVMRASNKSKAF